MPRPDPMAPKEGQESLFEAIPAAVPGKLLRGRHSDAMDSAFNEARSKDLIRPEDEALVTILRAGAWSLDAFEAQNKPYGPSKIITPLVEALQELGLTPRTRDNATDKNLQELLSGLDATDDAETPLYDSEDARP